eukprot:11520523-Alexandrium_andersonii.AAC.1
MHRCNLTLEATDVLQPKAWSRPGREPKPIKARSLLHAVRVATCSLHGGGLCPPGPNKWQPERPQQEFIPEGPEAELRAPHAVAGAV